MKHKNFKTSERQTYRETERFQQCSQIQDCHWEWVIAIKVEGTCLLACLSIKGHGVRDFIHRRISEHYRKQEDRHVGSCESFWSDRYRTKARESKLFEFYIVFICLFVCLFVLLSLFQRCTWTKLAPGLPLTLRPRFGFGLRSTLELCKCSGFWFLALCTRSSFSGTTCLFASVGQDFTSSSHSPALTYRIGEALECGPLDVPVHVHPSLLVRFAAPVKVVEGFRCRKSSVQHLLQQVVVGL